MIRQGPTAPLIPPQRADLPLWFALVLKRQRRANILAPAWLTPLSLQTLLELEKRAEGFTPSPGLPASNETAKEGGGIALSPPFLPQSTATGQADCLPYHWLELGTMLLREASEDVPNAEQLTRLLRDLREVRMAKLRAGISVLEGAREVGMDGVGGLEVAEGRAFVGGVVDGLRVVGASMETERREREEEGGQGYDDEDDDDGMDE